jgi:hypothetical protein
VVHIDTDNASAAALHAHWDHDNPTFPVLTGCGSIYSQYGNGYIPYNVILDPQGVLRYTASGFNPTAMHQVIEQYLVVDTPALSIAQLQLDDTDGDGRPEAGETVLLTVELANSPIAVAAWDLELEVTCADPGLTWSQTEAALAALAPGESAALLPALEFSVADPAEPRWVQLDFLVRAQYADGLWEQSFSRELRIGRPGLLLVDADGSAFANETWAVQALQNLGLAHDLWSPPDHGILPAAEALAYERIIWLGGRDNADLASGERAALSAFLERGGLLLLSTQFGGNAPAAAPFLSQWFDISVSTPYAGNVFRVEGHGDDPWFSGMELLLTGSGGANNLVDPDRITLGPQAQLLGNWMQGEGGAAAAWRTGPGWRAIFCGFPIEAMRVHGSLPLSVNLTQFLERVFAFDAAHAQPPAPVQASLSYQDGSLWLSWTPSPEAAAYRVYSLGEPWGGEETLLLETTATAVSLPAAPPAGWLRVRALR